MSVDLKLKPINIAIIVLDSLRYDYAIEANTPNLDKLGPFKKAYSCGWFTLPVHFALFHSGFTPRSKTPGAYYYKDRRFFTLQNIRTEGKGSEGIKSLYVLPDENNFVKSLESIGYKTVGVGGVSWFDTRCQLSREVWKQFFSDGIYWQTNFEEHVETSFVNQIEFTSSLKLKQYNPLFFFMNVSATHMPYSFGDQRKALEHVDKYMPWLLDLLPKPMHLFIFADHGDCRGEGGLYGHKIYHPILMDVPILNRIVL